MNTCRYFCKALDRVGNINCVNQKRNQRTCRNIAVDNTAPAVPHNNCYAYGSYKFNRRSKQSVQLDIFHIGIKVFFILVIKPVNFVVFAHKRFNNPRRRYGFLQNGSQFCRTLLNFTAVFTDFLAEIIHKPQNNWECTEGKQRQFPIQPQHGYDTADKHQPFRYEFYRFFYHCRLQSGNIIGNITHNGAGFIFIIKSQAQTL